MGTLSHSQVELLRPGGCSELHHIRYDLRLKTDTTPIHFGFGSAVHSGIEYNLRQKIETGADCHVQGVLNAFDVRWSAECQKSGLDWGRSTPAQYRADAHKLLRMYHTELAPRIALPGAVEAHLVAPIPGTDWKFQGYLDCLGYDDASKLGIWDHKTTSSGKVWTQQKADAEGQADAYYWLHRATQGRLPDFFRFMVLVRDGYRGKHRVLEVETHRTPAQIDAYEDLLRYCVGLRMAGLHVPNPNYLWHTTCPFVGRCTPWQQVQQEQYDPDADQMVLE